MRGTEAKALSVVREMSDAELSAKAMHLQREKDRYRSRISHSIAIHVRRILAEARNREISVYLMEDDEREEMRLRQEAARQASIARELPRGNRGSRHNGTHGWNAQRRIEDGPRRITGESRSVGAGARARVPLVVAGLKVDGGGRASGHIFHIMQSKALA